VTRRVVLTGPECSGKTTLAAALARHFRAPWLPEAARAHAESVGRELTAADAEIIARNTIAAEDAALATSPPLIFLDTDLISTVVYTRHYYGATPAWIETEARARRADVYLLCAPDLPWTADGVRDRPAQREELHALFERTLAEFECVVVEVSGTGLVRERAALAAAGALIAAGQA
jgi:NadR type nicotinamide-nucleotide adenylyltransferase